MKKRKPNCSTRKNKHYGILYIPSGEIIHVSLLNNKPDDACFNQSVKHWINEEEASGIYGFYLPSSAGSSINDVLIPFVCDDIRLLNELISDKKFIWNISMDIFSIFTGWGEPETEKFGEITSNEFEIIEIAEISA